jgi:putative transposase
MGKRGHSEEEILRVLRVEESGGTVVETCREHGISQQSFYLWKKEYAGLGLQELRELRQLRDENAKLKRLLADLSLDRHILQAIIARNCKASCATRAGRVGVGRPRPEPAACGKTDSGRPDDLALQHHCDPQESLRVRMRELAGSRVRYGYPGV